MGEVLDIKGRPIRLGDLLRSYHFKDRRWGHQYLYHGVVKTGDVLEAVPVEELITGVRGGGRYWINPGSIETTGAEIIKGGGPFPENIYQERKAKDVSVASK